jgi:alpha-N-arabinofuranosidase
MYEFDPSRLAVVGDERILVNGGTDITRKPVWIEGPHIFRKNGFYYLIAAEGGTGDQHSEVVFRSANVAGPYVPYEQNPILTQRNLDPKRAHPVTSTGHADFVDTKTGDWWAVFLGCRPYPPVEEGFYNTGRETFMAPVRWENGWPVVNPGHETVQYSYPLPVLEPGMVPAQSYSGNYAFRDEFNAPALRGDFEFLRTPREKWYSLTDRSGFCSVRVRPQTCSEPVNPAFIGLRQSHATGTVSVSLDFRPAAENEKAGLLVFQNERRWYFLCRSLSGGVPAIELFVSTDAGVAGHDMRLLASANPGPDSAVSTVALKIGARGSSYAFFYAVRPGDWRLLKDDVSAAYLSTKSAGGFVGCIYAMYATSLGSPSSATAYFDWFEYRGDDEIYR